MRHTTQQHSVFASGFVTRFVVAWMVCCSLLNLPIPVLHQHYAHDGLELAEHVERYHSGAAATDCESGEWHWHLVYPNSTGDDEDVSCDPPSLLGFAHEVQHANVDIADEDILTSICVVGQPTGSTVIPPPALIPGHNDSIPHTERPRLLLCVMRC